VRWPGSGAATAAGIAGIHRSRRQGSAAEFTEYRAYRQGDDARRIDWRVLARTDRAFIRITDDHAVRPTTLILDAGASMAFPETTQRKWETAELIALGLASVALRSGDPVDVTIAADGGILARDFGQHERSVQQLADMVTSVVVAGSPPLAAALSRALQRHRSRRRVIIISDFLGDLDETQSVARTGVAAGVELFIIHVVATEELRPPDGDLLVTDARQPSVRRVLSARTRKAYAEAFATWRASLHERWRATGAVSVMALTDEAPATVIRRLIRSPAPVATVQLW
jgi:uncharacterized protein (DUF58 family)